MAHVVTLHAAEAELRRFPPMQRAVVWRYVNRAVPRLRAAGDDWPTALVSALRVGLARQPQHGPHLPPWDRYADDETDDPTPTTPGVIRSPMP